MNEKVNNQELITIDSLHEKGLTINNTTLTLKDIKRMTKTDTLKDVDVLDFMMLCHTKGANPLLKEAYLLPFTDSKTHETKTNIIFSKEFFVRKAEEQPDFNGMENHLIVLRNGKLVETNIVVDGIDVLIGATANVYRKGIDHPFSATVSFREYNTGKTLWQTKPATMIRKVAIVQALREAYGGLFGGVYTSEELRLGEDVFKEETTITETHTPSSTQNAVAQAMANNANIVEAEVVEEKVEEEAPKIASFKDRIPDMLDALSKLGITKEMIENKLATKIEKISKAQFEIICNWYRAVNSNEKTIEEIFKAA